MSSENYQMLAKTFAGLENVLMTELEELGASDIEIVTRGVKFRGSKEILYKANFCCRTASRILRIIGEYKVKNNNDLYQSIYKIDWTEYFNADQTFAINSTVDSEAFNNSMYVSLKAKDAIVDQFRAKTGKRPSVNTENPDIRINVHASSDEFSISLDSSGESLHKRGYRIGQNEASMSEILAAGIIKIVGWKGQCDFYDGMCGSGTIAVEAALIARNIPPGIFRKSFAFEAWKDFDADLFEEVYNDDYEVPFEHTIFASDINSANVKLTERNAKSAGLKSEIEFNVQDFASLVPKSKDAILIINPPYGERMNERKMEPLYTMIGDSLKKNFKGCQVWVFSGSENGFKSIGLRSAERIPLFNGPIECSLRKYELFDGNQKEYKERQFNNREENQTVRGNGQPENRERSHFNTENRPFSKPERSDRRSEFKPRDNNRPPRSENRGDFSPSREGNRSEARGEFKPRRDNNRPPRPESRGDFKPNRENSNTGNGRRSEGFGQDRRSDSRLDRRSNNRQGFQGDKFSKAPAQSEKPTFEYLNRRPKLENRVEILSSDLKHTDKKGVYQPKEESPKKKQESTEGKAKRKRI
jgi:putative N6-adenine-specific DNA methylase